MKIERTFFEKVKLFIYPFYTNKKVYFKSFFAFTLWYLPSIISVVFLQKIISSLSQNNETLFYKTLFLYIGTIIIYDIFYYIFGKIGWTDIEGDIKNTIQRKYLRKYVNLDNNRIETIGTGKSIAIISKGLKVWARLTYDLLANFANMMISFIFVIYMISKVSIFMPFLLLGFMILGQYFSVLLNRKIMNLRKKRIKEDNIWIKNIVKILMSKFEILQNNKINKEVDYLDNLQNKVSKYNRKIGYYSVYYFRIPDWIVIFMLFMTFLYFGKLYFSGIIDLPLLVGVSGALILSQGALYRTITFFKDFTKNFSELDVFWEFFDNTPEMKGYEEGGKFKYKNGDIKINNLSYGYSDNKLVFDNFSIKINGGEVTAFVGESGGGKSTFVKLIAGYIRSSSGDIVIDNQKINEISLKSYYKDIGYLTQEPSVFDGTVIDNLTYAIDRSLKEKELEDVLKLAKCDFVYELPAGLETEIGERGVKLSGGQKQRLAIAKIFLKNPKIIILDEPTSALDSFSEEQITKAMHNLFKDRTVIIIAHRLQTVKNADDIILLENGRIEERGTHTELVKLKGKYKKMLDLQSGF